jgi:hypothetical protein
LFELKFTVFAVLKIASSSESGSSFGVQLVAAPASIQSTLPPIQVRGSAQVGEVETATKQNNASEEKHFERRTAIMIMSDSYGVTVGDRHPWPTSRVASASRTDALR